MKTKEIVVLSYKNSFIGVIHFFILFAISLILNEIYIFVINEFQVNSVSPTSIFDVTIVLLFGLIILTPLFFAVFGTVAIITGLMLRDLKDKV